MPEAKAATVKKKRFAIKTPRIDPAYNYAIIVAAVGIVAALLLAIFAVRPLALKLIHDTQDLNNKRIESGQLKEKITTLKELRVNYERLGETNRQKIVVALPTDGDAAHLLAVVESVGLRNGVQVRGIIPAAEALAPEQGAEQAAPVQLSETPSLPANIIVRGSYPAILAFLVGLERAPRLMDIASVSFSGTGSPLEASINVKAHYKPDGATAGGAE